MWITPSEETREVCGTRYINSQVEEEKVGVCKQLMDFFTVCRESRSERRKSRKREEGGQNFFSSLCQHFRESSGGLRSLFKRLKSLWNHFVAGNIQHAVRTAATREAEHSGVVRILPAVWSGSPNTTAPASKLIDRYTCWCAYVNFIPTAAAAVPNRPSSRFPLNQLRRLL